MKVTLYHNPACSKSRKTLALLRDRGIEPEIIEYLKHPPDKNTLQRWLSALRLSARDILRSHEETYKELGLDDMRRSEEELISAMAAYPKLIQRPIVVYGEQVILARPPERVAELFSVS